MSTESTRFRSFAERYVIERAATFRVGYEEQDAWRCTIEAKSIYKRIGEVSREFE